ncbi:hypothetical protein K504DRAFT_462199 [Pleomassaria siparia CBS 279.74]|uniref:Uncharacterized protein n=1 Tax=Pleomassaria siparia CBS 279.74 TaxID=1314801 RepID=A0A6G1KMC0_9PLEO|nr:hypothetical protein K504DRAFT_462199 [Pleomassaria siparia CBS 279.74]
MAATLLPTGGIALHGAPDSDIGSRDAKHSPIQAMQLEITQDIVDELLESVRSGKSPQILFGRTPQLKYGDKTHMLQTSSENYRYELYHASGAGSDDHLEFAGLMNHSLAVQKVDNVTAGVDTALEQLKSSMAAISEFKEANKTIVGGVTPVRTPVHRRLPSKGLKAQHLATSSLGSPLLSLPNSPMSKRPPTSQPSSNHIAVLSALRVPLIHLLAVQPSKDTHLASTCRTSLANVRDLLPKIAKRSSEDADKWQLTDKSFRELNPFQFTYRNAEDRDQAIASAIKSFDRLRLAKDDKLWQLLLPRDERGQGKCLSRLTVKAHEAKPSTPLHKITKMNDKKPATAKRADDKDADKEPKKAKEVKVKAVKAAPKPKKPVKEKVIKDKIVRNEAKLAAATGLSTPTTTTTSTSKPSAPSPASRSTPLADASRIRTKKVAPTTGEGASTPRVKPKMSSARDVAPKDRVYRPTKPSMPVNTKPKNPSPLSASPPVNASDFEDNHPVHKALSAAPSPAKASTGNSDRTLKRKANDVDSDIHNHGLAVKQPRMDRATSGHSRTSSSSTNGRVNGNTPSSNNSLKRKSDESSTSNTPTNKVRKVTSINTGLASRYPTHNTHVSPGGSSSATTSPSLPSLSFRQTVELSQKFQKYYKKYEELYWQLTEAEKAPTEAQRGDLLKMHKKLEEMKREIKAGSGAQR